MTEGQTEIVQEGNKVIIARGVSRFKVAPNRVMGLIVDVLALCYLYTSARLLLLQLPAVKKAVQANPDEPALYLPWAVVFSAAIVISMLWGSLGRSLGRRLGNTIYFQKGRKEVPFGNRLIHALLNIICMAPAYLGLWWLHTHDSSLRVPTLATLPLLLLFLYGLVNRKGQTIPDLISGIQVSLPEHREVADVRIRPRPWYTRSWGALALLLLILSYTTGWVITKIDIPSFVKDAANAKPLLLDLVRPDLFERAPSEQWARAEYQIPCTDTPPGPAIIQPGKPGVVIVRGGTCGDRGNFLQVRGENFEPNAKGTLFWVAPNGLKDRIRVINAEADGTFEYTFTVPNARALDYEVHEVEAVMLVPSGPWQATKTLRMVLDKMIETVFLALMATTLGVILSIPISFLSARNLMIHNPLSATIYYVTRTIMNIFRSIEPLIWALIFVVWVGIGPFAGVLALTLHTIAALAKLYSEAIENIDPGPIEAITATGADRLQTIIYAVIPQMIPPFIAFTIYRWDINVRMSTVIGLVGGGGIGFLLIQWINLLQYRQAATAVWAIALVVAIMDYTSAIVREKLV
jgi:phosphonate transport system permease protein